VVKIIGLEALQSALQKMIAYIRDPELVTSKLADLMRDYVHRQSGYLASTIYHSGPEAGATAPYAQVEEDRGGSHAFGTRAVNAFNERDYLDKIVEPF